MLDIKVFFFHDWLRCLLGRVTVVCFLLRLLGCDLDGALLTTDCIHRQYSRSGSPTKVCVQWNKKVSKQNLLTD
jgi:hypothetical protein